jgi:Rrf2 family protein
MIRISHKVQYAVRAVFDIAHATDERPALLHDVARRQAIPLPFLEQICRQLKAAGILVGRRGPLGGYRLARAPALVSVGDVIRAVEGEAAFELHDRERGGARRVIEPLWTELGAALAGACDAVHMDELSRRAERGGVPRRGAPTLDYSI